MRQAKEREGGEHLPRITIQDSQRKVGSKSEEAHALGKIAGWACRDVAANGAHRRRCKLSFAAHWPGKCETPKLMGKEGNISSKLSTLIMDLFVCLFFPPWFVASSRWWVWLRAFFLFMHDGQKWSGPDPLSSCLHMMSRELPCLPHCPPVNSIL